MLSIETRIAFYSYDAYMKSDPTIKGVLCDDKPEAGIVRFKFPMSEAENPSILPRVEAEVKDNGYQYIEIGVCPAFAANLETVYTFQGDLEVRNPDGFIPGIV